MKLLPSPGNRPAAGLLLALLTGLVWASPRTPGREPGRNQLLDGAFGAFWNAGSPAEAEEASRRILESGASFEEIRQRLEAGRPYQAKVKRGRILRTRRNRDGLKHHYMLLVPQDYDPSRRYPVRFYLHGGIGRPAMKRDGSWWQRTERVARSDAIVALPASWKESPWWGPSQIENLQGILQELKQDYNIDENRVHLLGISDGGTGVFYQAFRAPTPWAAFISLIGHPAVLARESPGQMHVSNLANRSFLAINGGQDPLYPTSSVKPYLELFRRAGAQAVFRSRPQAGHTVRWWPEEAEFIEGFIRNTPRIPLPERLSWETESTGFNRCHWLLITQLREAGEGDSVSSPTAASRSRES